MTLAMILNILLLFIYGASSMEMRETVERMVMVRRTGSDLDPAATGFIYKRSSDEPAKVIKLEKDEVLEQMKKMPEKLYVQPHAFTAPIPVVRGPFAAKSEDSPLEVKPSETHIIPVVEETEEAKEQVDGLADEDDGFLVNEYADYKKHLDEYFHALENGDEYKGNSESKDANDEDHSNKKGSDDYHTEKYEAYSISDKESYEKNYGDEKGNDGSDVKSRGEHGGKTEEADEYAKLFEENKKHFDYYDGKAFEDEIHKHGADDEYNGGDSGAFTRGDHHVEGFQEGGLGENRYHEAPSAYGFGDTHAGSEGYPGDFDADFGKGYRFEIKH